VIAHANAGWFVIRIRTMALAALREIFRAEVEELLVNLDAGLVELERSRDSESARDRLFRAGHTLKGIGGVIGWVEFMRLTHALESVLDHLRGGTLRASDELIGALFAGIDSVQRMVRAGEASDSALLGYGPALNRLRALEPPAPESMIPGMPSLYEIVLRFRHDLAALSEDTKLLLDQLGVMGELVSVEPLPESMSSIERDAIRVPPGLRVLLRTAESEIAIKGVCVYSADEDRLRIVRLAESCRDVTEPERASRERRSE
jgi:two-component system, chemotaxis family, sensor kinase CheA